MSKQTKHDEDYKDYESEASIESDKSDDSYIPSDTEGETSGRWTSQEDELLRYYVKAYGSKQWKKVAEHILNRTPSQCLHRWKNIIKPGLVKGNWTKEEDEKLFKWVENHGAKKWSGAMKVIKGRNGKQIRERWFNHLNPDMKRTEWSQEEDEMIFELYQRYGTSWCKIAKHMPGRPENSIKNRFYSTLRKIVLKKNKRSKGRKSDYDLEDEDEDDDERTGHLFKILENRIIIDGREDLQNESKPIKVGNSSVVILQEEALGPKSKTEKSKSSEDSFKESMLSSEFDRLRDDDDDEMRLFRQSFKPKPCLKIPPPEEEKKKEAPRRRAKKVKTVEDFIDYSNEDQMTPPEREIEIDNKSSGLVSEPFLCPELKKIFDQLDDLKKFYDDIETRESGNAMKSDFFENDEVLFREF